MKKIYFLKVDILLTSPYDDLLALIKDTLKFVQKRTPLIPLLLSEYGKNSKTCCALPTIISPR